jgi:hypothetical protein
MGNAVVPPVWLSVVTDQVVERQRCAGARAHVAPPAITQLRFHRPIIHRHGSERGIIVVVTVLVDECRWWFKNRRWCHMVSDVDLDELHRHAAKLGIPRRVFQGDHYDVPEELRDEAIALGAQAVPSRELVRRLRDAGLRVSPAARRAAQPLPRQSGRASVSSASDDA